MTDYFDELFADASVMIILRGLGPDRTVALCETAWRAGIAHVEVPVQEPESERALAAAVEAGRVHGRVVGAGTITTLERLRAARRLGAAFTVSPGADEALLRMHAEERMPLLPGVATASEIQLAQRHGHSWMKAFPASVLGTEWFRAMHGPFPEVRFVATGGMTPDTAGAFIAAGVSVVAFGSVVAQEGVVERVAADLVHRAA